MSLCISIVLPLTYLLLSTKVDANLSIKFHSYSTIILWLPVSKGFFFFNISILCVDMCVWI